MQKQIQTKLIEIVAGPNGSGKTTFAESYLLRTKNNLVFLNPDIIASGIAPLNFESASFNAGRVLINEVKSRIENNESFAFESTLSGRSWAHTLKQAQDQDYQIVIYFLFLKSVKINLQRIQKRVKLGGHNIPKQAVLRRQSRCFDNFWNLYRPLSTDWYIFDNSNSQPKLVSSKTQFEAFKDEQQKQFIDQFLQGKVHEAKTR